MINVMFEEVLEFSGSNLLYPDSFSTSSADEGWD
jgi:hypothetical protein